MEEIFREYFGVLIFLFFILFPKLFRFLITRGGRTPSRVEKTLEDLLQGEIKLPESIPQSVVLGRKEKIQKLVRLAEKLRGQTAEIRDRCIARNLEAGKIQRIVETVAVSPIAAARTDLALLQAREEIPSEHEIAHMSSRIQSLKAKVAILEELVSLRTLPAFASTIAILDKAVEEGFRPYLSWAEQRHLAYSTKFTVSYISETGRDAARVLAGSPAAAAMVNPKTAELPRGWINLISDVSTDVFFSTRGLSQRLETDAGAIRTALSIPLLYNPTVFVSALLNAWLPRIFGDIGAAVYLGPSLALGLASMHRWGFEDSRALLTDIGGPEFEVPVYIRMFVVCRTLQYTGFSDESYKIWESWQKRFERMKTMTVRDASQKEASLSLPMVLTAVSRAVDVVIAAPIAALGNQLLMHIPSLPCTQRDRARMTEIARDLIQGVPVNAPSRIIIGAALDAAWKSSSVEAKIGAAAMKSMAGKGEVREAMRLLDIETVGSVADAMFSDHTLMQAMALGGAFSPRKFSFGPGRLQ